MALSFINWLFPCKEHARLEDELHLANVRVRELESLLRDEKQKHAELKQSKAEDWAAACKSAQAASSAIADLQNKIYWMRTLGRSAGS